MRTSRTHSRAALALLLVASACLFAVGSALERHQGHREARVTESTAPTGEASSSESGEEGTVAESLSHQEAATKEVGVKILGVDTESVALSVVAVALSLLLAAAVWRFGSMPVLLVVAAFGLVFAAGDVRELAHQLSESRASIAAIAAALVVLHLGVSSLAGLPVPRARAASG